MSTGSDPALILQQLLVRILTPRWKQNPDGGSRWDGAMHLDGTECV